MQQPTIELYDQTLQLIASNISITPLLTRRNECAEFVQLVEDPEMVLLSFDDVSTMKEINESSIIPIIDYLNQIVLEELKNELTMENENEFFKIYLKFKDAIMVILMDIEHTIKQIPSGSVTTFLAKYGNGLLNDHAEFRREFEKVAFELSENKIKSNTRRHQIETIINNALLNINKQCDSVNSRLKLLIKNVKEFRLPKLFKLVDEIEINKGKSIPQINGIDIHPNRNVYITMGCENGDLVIRDQDTNTEINRVKLSNNSGGATQSCLWSPSGDKIMVSTYQNHSIYIYDETGQNLIKSIENTYSKIGYGAVWLSKNEVSVGYADGTVKFFNVDEGKEIGSVNINGKYVLGMDCIDEFHLLVGDNSGSITNIDWKKKKFEWIKTGWHLNWIRCLKSNYNKTMLLSGGDDYFVKLMKLQDQSMLWKFKLNSSVYGISWVPGELYILALSLPHQLVAINSNNGTKIIEFNGLSSNPRTLRVNFRKPELFIGDANSIVRRLKIYQT